MGIFTEQKELIRFAIDFIDTRIDSLERDVNYCIKEKPFAPFPAILYCFSTIDLLAALLNGDASKNAPTTAPAAKYMQRFMYYTEEQTNLLQNLFRHKIVHLAQPKAIIIDKNSQLVSWRYWHENEEYHLKLIKLPQNVEIQITSSLKITCDYEFNLSILKFMQDIKESSKDYIAELKTSADIQDKFEKAITDIYTP